MDERNLFDQQDFLYEEDDGEVDDEDDAEVDDEDDSEIEDQDDGEVGDDDGDSDDGYKRLDSIGGIEDLSPVSSDEEADLVGDWGDSTN